LRLRAAILLGLAWSAPALAQSALPPEVQAVIDRSKTTRANYSVTMTAEVVRDGQRVIELEAEFQQGALHRVEVPARRVLSNCDTGESYTYEIASARMESNVDQSDSVCGIALAADPPISGRLLAPVTGDYGRADVIELVGGNFIRRYAVTADGIIVALAYVPRRPEVGFSLRSLSVTVSRGPQDPAMFDRRSLDRAFASAPPSGD
jgi:hypothetical protein